MKREIKFRAWDKIECQMLFSGIDYQLRLISHICQDEFADESVIGFSRLDWDRFDLMQFTGLKDKNDKEVYEGDIVRYYVSAPWDDEVPLEVRAEVMFDDPFYGCFCVKSREGHMDATGCLYEYIHGIEVIGNIYENKELLK